MQVRLARAGEREAAVARLAERWGDPVIARSQVFPIDGCEIFIAGDMAGLAAVSRHDKPIAELVAINAFTPFQGVGSYLLRAIVGSLDGFDALRLTTTNDNLDALRFYQRRGFRLTALRPGAIDAMRLQKPRISLTGRYGIPIRDELDLCLEL
ncbi:MAG TPA: GNAT family N-acetyltransferase [Acetobacteraceae bacterium]|jgi:GNAT superfamily N-acetyltransferase